MLSYQHAYHAGNFADVHKHTLLATIIEYLTLKPKPFGVLDVNAGRGFYDLTGREAQKTAEFEQGIGAVWSHITKSDNAYARILKACNPDGQLRYYPGSPDIARRLMRIEDRLVLVEKHPQEYDALKEYTKSHTEGPAIQLHKRDSYEALNALVPPVEKRGLILIDPSYEHIEDYEKVVATLCQAYKKWPTGIYMVWYPVLSAGYHKPMIQVLKAVSPHYYQEEKPGMSNTQGRLLASGVFVINPPHIL